MNRLTNISKYCGYLLFAVLISYMTVFAQEGNPENNLSTQPERLLGNHFFTPSAFIRSPYILTSVSTSIGIGGITNIKYPEFEINDQKYHYQQGDIYAALLAFHYQHAVKDWLVLFLQIDILGRLGSDFGTLMAEGINYSTNFDIGWMIKLYHKNRFVLAGTIEVTNGDYSLISLQQFANDIAEGKENPSLTTENNSLYGSVGVNGAYGFSSFFGLNFEANLGYGETIQRELKNEVFTILGINADMNFSKIIHTPLSLSLGYLHSSYPQSHNDVTFSTNLLFAQLSYIGKSDLVLSLDLSFSRELYDIDQSVLWLKTIEFSMRYFL